MTHLPRISGRDAIRALAKIGYEVVRQKGSHVRLRHPRNERPPLTIPAHKELKAGTLSGIIRQAGLSPDELIELLKIEAQLAAASQPPPRTVSPS